MIVGLMTVLVVGFFARPAQAQVSPAEPGDHRGPAVSVTLGGGYSADASTGGIARTVAVDIGWFVARRFGVLVGLTAVTRGEDEWMAYNVLHLAVEYWTGSGWYVRTALGNFRAARLRPIEGWLGSTTGEDLGLGVGALFAAGRPVWSWRRVALNLQVTAGAGLFPDDAASKGAGFIVTGLELAVQ